MIPTLLLDTHILIHWMLDSPALTRDQSRALRKADAQGIPFGVSAITLVELAQLVNARKVRSNFELESALNFLEDHAKFIVLPIDSAVVRELPRCLPILRDPMDSIIAATAQVHNLALVTSDQRILDSKLVRTIE